MTLTHGQRVLTALKRQRIADLGPGGGYVLGAVHNIQAEVPPENVLAMWAALDEAGRYA